MKNLFVKIRTSIKFLILVCIATFLVVGAVAYIYKPIYSVTLNGELIGYCAQKRNLQARIDEYIENGEGENAAFVEVDEMPSYSLCLLKRGITTNDDEIYEKIKQIGTTYYKYYAIIEDGEEKAYVTNFETAENVLNELKDKNSDNIDNIQIIEKYETALAEFITQEQAVSSLYKEKKPEPTVTKVAKKSSKVSGSFTTATNISKGAPSIGISLIKPVTGSISSRFGARSSIRSSAHTGLDIATSTGTPVKAANSGTVTFAGYKGSYGNLVVLTHSNGVQTYYGHCSKIYVSTGQSVSQGETISAVGSTGNSTGPHLHFEIRVNGVAYNPQNYLY